VPQLHEQVDALRANHKELRENVATCHAEALHPSTRCMSASTSPRSAPDGSTRLRSRSWRWVLFIATALAVAFYAYDWRARRAPRGGGHAGMIAGQ
jgi:hypothetical protein